MQLAQVAHASFQFSQDYPIETKEWLTGSNYIAILASPNEQDLIQLIEQTERQNIKHSVFREDDLNNEITCVAIEPCEASKALCKKYQLALRNYR